MGLNEMVKEMKNPQVAASPIDICRPMVRFILVFDKEKKH